MRCQIAGFLKLLGRHQEALDSLRQSLGGIQRLASADSAARPADLEVQVLGLLARGELQLGNAAAYRGYCQAMVERCRRRNCYEYDALRACLLLPDAVNDPTELVVLTKEAATQGSRTLRKRANIGGSLYRAGQFEEAAGVLKNVYESNRMALLARLGTAEVVRADNARVAALAAMAYARLGQLGEARRWLGLATKWLADEGGKFAIEPRLNSGHDQSPAPEITATDPTAPELSGPPDGKPSPAPNSKTGCFWPTSRSRFTCWLPKRGQWLRIRRLQATQ